LSKITFTVYTELHEILDAGKNNGQFHMWSFLVGLKLEADI